MPFLQVRSNLPEYNSLLGRINRPKITLHTFSIYLPLFRSWQLRLFTEPQLPDEDIRRLLTNGYRGVIRINSDFQVLNAIYSETCVDAAALLPRGHLTRAERVPGATDVSAGPALEDGVIVDGLLEGDRGVDAGSRRSGGE